MTKKNRFRTLHNGQSSSLAVVTLLTCAVLIGLAVYIIPKIGKDDANISRDKATVEAYTDYNKNAPEDNKGDDDTYEMRRTDIINTAAEYGASGDYFNAICVMKEDKDTYIDDESYMSTYDSYSQSYVNEVIKEADGFASSGDYINAMNAITETEDFLGYNDELDSKYSEYENSYVSSVISEADKLIDCGDLDDALSTVNTALEFVDNTKIENKRDSIKSMMPQYLVEILEPYACNDYEPFKGDFDSIMIGGVERFHGFTLDSYGWNGQSNAIYNLNKEYKQLSGIIGYKDDSTGDGMTWDAEIYVDDTLVYSQSIAPGELPYEFSVDLTGANKLEIRAGGQNGFKGLIGFADLQIVGTGKVAAKNEKNQTTLSGVSYLVDIMEPFSSNDYEAFKGEFEPVMMGGVERFNGFTLDTYGWNGQSCAIYNLNKSYHEISGLTGYVDNRIGDGKEWDVEIYADDVLIYKRTVDPEQLPENFTVDVTGVSKLEFRTGSTNGFKGYIGFAEITIQ